jgi:hypothetical protein
MKAALARYFFRPRRHPVRLRLGLSMLALAMPIKEIRVN